jgi:UDP-2,3-diacylglucosamine hydrolase
LGKLAELSDKGVGISLFGGNHDMWMKDYLSSEIGVKVYPSTIKVKAGDCSILVGHGDGLGPGDYAYKVIKVIFTNPVCRKLFSALHPWFGVGLAHFWSRTRKNNHVKSLEKAKSQPFVFRPEKEILLSYCQKVESKEHHDFHVFGHRHLAIDIKINDRSRYINLGHWLSDNSTFGVFDGKHFEIKGYECKTAPKVYPVT